MKRWPTVGCLLMSATLMFVPSASRADEPSGALDETSGAPTVVLEADGTVVAPEAAPPEAAAPTEQPAVSVLVRAEGAVDPEALQAALEEDLGVRVEIVRPDEEGAARVVIELTGDDRVRLRVLRDGAPPLTRETAPGTTREGTTVTVSLLVANLVRDESADLLSMLEPPPPVPPEPPVVVLGPAPPAPEVETEVEVEPEREVEPEPEAERPWIFAGIDFVPGLGVSTAYLGGERRTLSVGVVGGLHGGIDGLGLSSVVDVSLGNARGAQVAGVYAHSVEVSGVQLAGVAVSTEAEVNGLQGAGVASIGGDIDGAQVAGVLSLSTADVHGVQGAGIASLAGEVHGLQVAGTLNVAAAGVYGAQLAPYNVSAGPLRGAQIGQLNIAGDVSGSQVGMVNVAAGSVEGAQLGMVNVAGHVDGVQIGLFNVAESADAAIGLFSVNAQGHSHLRAEVGSAGFLRTSFVHRGPVTYSVLSAIVNPFLGPTGGVGLGFGVRAQPLDVFHLDVEIGAHVLFSDRLFGLEQSSPDGMFELRVLGGIHVFDGFTVLVGAGFQTMLTSDPDPEEIATMPIVFDGDPSDPTRFRGWPSLHAGVEFF